MPLKTPQTPQETMAKSCEIIWNKGFSQNKGFLKWNIYPSQHCCFLSHGLMTWMIWRLDHFRKPLRIWDMGWGWMVLTIDPQWVCLKVGDTWKWLSCWGTWLLTITSWGSLFSVPISGDLGGRTHQKSPALAMVYHQTLDLGVPWVLGIPIYPLVI